VAALRKRVERLDGLVDDQRRSIEALHRELGQLRALLPPPVYRSPRTSHTAVRTGRITT
jgi:hypothetical protein